MHIEDVVHESRVSPRIFADAEMKVGKFVRLAQPRSSRIIVGAKAVVRVAVVNTRYAAVLGDQWETIIAAKRHKSDYILDGGAYERGSQSGAGLKNLCIRIPNTKGDVQVFDGDCWSFRVTAATAGLAGVEYR